MPDLRLFPIAGISTEDEDAALQIKGDNPRIYVRDALNVNITPTGRVELIGGPSHVCASQYRWVWQSPLHGDVFGLLSDKWVKINPKDWTSIELATVGTGRLYHCVLNNLVCVSSDNGLFSYNGAQANRLSIDSPPPPFVQSLSNQGSLVGGVYGICVSWVRGGYESSPSRVSFIDAHQDDSIVITLPLCMDGSIESARIYATKPDGSRLYLMGDYPVSGQFTIALLPQLGRALQFYGLSPMPSGKYLCAWKGRMVNSRSNVLRFSQPMAYHVWDELHDFIQFPQTITFVQPVEGGIWVGQVDHVVFLSGVTPSDMRVEIRAAKPPIPGSHLTIKSELVGGNIAPDGSPVAAWLSENGYALGTSAGNLIELNGDTLSGIYGQSGQSVVQDDRIFTLCN